MGHMKQIQEEVCSTTTKPKQGRPAKDVTAHEAVNQDAIAEPKQAPGNENTNLVFMTTQKAEGFIASDQTGMLSRTSNRGMTYICIFYLFDPNFIKGVPIKSRKKEEPQCAYKEVYS